MGYTAGLMESEDSSRRRGAASLLLLFGRVSDGAEEAAAGRRTGTSSTLQSHYVYEWMYNVYLYISSVVD